MRTIERFLDELIPLRLPGCDDAYFVSALLSREASRTSRRMSASGVGFTPDLALRSCLGEAAEYLSFLRRIDDPLVVEHAGFREKVSGFGDTEGALVNCRNAVTGSVVGVPSYMVLREPEQAGAGTRTTSNGLGAGSTIEHAKLHGLLELIERHEVMSWWLLQEPRPGIDASTVRTALPETGSRADAGEGPPGPWFLLLTGRTHLPVVGAFSEHMDTCEVACGFKAATTLHAAIRGAFLELRQHELALHIARLRNEVGQEIKVSDFPCLIPADNRSGLTSSTRASSFDKLSQHLDRLGIQVLWTDLTRPDVAIPVARVLSFELQGPPTGSIINLPGVGTGDSAMQNSKVVSLPNLY